MKNIDQNILDLSQFSLDIFKEAAEQIQYSSLILSPYNIFVAFLMVYTGALDNTATQIQQALNLHNMTEVNTHYIQQVEKLFLSQQDNISMKTSNNLWPSSGLQLEQYFLDTCQNQLNSNVQSLDYSNAKQASDTINNQIAKETNNMIKNLLKPEDIDKFTSLIITSAIHFKGDWKYQFKKSDTIEKYRFNLENGSKKRVNMMYQQNRFNFIQDGRGYKAIELPYKGEAFSMVVVLPDQNVSLQQCIQNFQKGDIQKLNQDLNFQNNKEYYQKVEVYLPKFVQEYSQTLNNILKNLGIKDAFQSTANFKGISQTSDLYIGSVIHQAKIIVDEEGSEAAAATATIMKARSSQTNEPVIPVFKADRPFLYYIKDNKFNNIYFMGTFNGKQKI